MGAIVALSNSPVHESDQWLDIHHPEVEDFQSLKGSAGGAEQARRALSTSDEEMIRVIEDLIDLLIAKQVFIFTELPKPVREKLSRRHKLRKEVGELNNLMNDDEDIF
jgi:hypothetical protein